MSILISDNGLTLGHIARLEECAKRKERGTRVSNGVSNGWKKNEQAHAIFKLIDNRDNPLTKFLPPITHAIRSKMFQGGYVGGRSQSGRGVCILVTFGFFCRLKLVATVSSFLRVMRGKSVLGGGYSDWMCAELERAAREGYECTHSHEEIRRCHDSLMDSGRLMKNGFGGMG